MVDGPVSNRRFSRRQIRSFLMVGGGIIVALVVAVGGWKFYTSSRQAAAEQAQQEQEAYIAARASEVATPFSAQQARLDELAAAPATIALFVAGDQAGLDAAAGKALANFDRGLKLRYLLPGRYELDNNSNPPLGYASLDLLRRVEKDGSSVAMEALLLGSDRQHIVMLSAVKDEEESVIGILHLSLSVDLFKSGLAAVDLPGGYLELQQGAGAKVQVLASAGDAALKTGEAISTIVRGTRWKVAVWGMNASPVNVGGMGMQPLIMVIVAILVLGGLAAVFILKKGGKADTTTSNEVIYAGAVRAIMDGAHPGMEKMVPNLPAGDGSASAAASVSQGAVGDDITMIIKKEDVKAAADSEMLDLTQAEPVTPTPEAPPAPEPAPAPAESAPVESAPAAPAEAAAPAPAAADSEVPKSIFRAYDIRGVVGETLNADIVRRIGQAIGSEAGTQGQSTLAVGRDGRTSSPELAEALIQGLRDSGRDVIDVGVVPTPVLYFATHFLDVNSGIMLTGSHNGPSYNGLKIVINGDTLAEDGIQAIYNRVSSNDFESGQGSVQTSEIIADYIRRVSEDIPVAFGNSLKIVVDCGNGVAGAVAPQLLRALGHDVVELYCEIDGNFPNHHPDPSQPENLQALKEKVAAEEADLGLAFDGDADRLGVVDEQGNIIWPDRQLMLLAKDVLTRNAGAQIIFDVKCSRYLKAIIESSGGKPLMWKTGHSLIKKKMKEVDAPLAGEMSGHIFFKERWYGFDDAIYTAARILEILMAAGGKPSEVFAQMPEGVSTPELRLDLPEDAHQSFMQGLQGKLQFDGAEIIDIDGYRAEFSDGWGLVRPSNTTPCLVMRFEAESQDALERIQGEFRTALLSINPDLQLPF